MKVALITNIPAPYRVDLFDYFNAQNPNIEFHIFYGGMPESQGRNWTIDQRKMKHTHFYNIKEIRRKSNGDIRYIQIYSDIIRHLSMLKPDVVISMEYNISAVQSMIWCKMHKTPYIHMTDGTLFQERNIGKGQRLLRRLIIGNANGYIASSSKAKEKLLYWGAPENKISVAYLTTNLESYKGVPRNPQNGRILYVGSTIPRKGLDLLFEALEKVRYDYELRIVGNGNGAEVRQLKELAYSLGIEKRIAWCGYKEGNALKQEYAKADFFILPTREDCFGLVLLEAAASRVPIISSKYADGSYDIVEDGVNGLIVDPYHSKEMAIAIEKMLLDKQYRQNASEIDLSKFNYQSVYNAYMKAINGVLFVYENSNY